MFFDPEKRRAFDEQRTRDAQAVLQALQEALAVLPELRVGQLIENAKYTLLHSAERDLFYVENSELAQAIRDFTAEQLRMKPSRGKLDTDIYTTHDLTGPCKLSGPHPTSTCLRFPSTLPSEPLP